MLAPSKALKVTVQGRNMKVDLDDKCALGSGGEGDAYLKGGIVYKVYRDPTKMIPLNKIKELQVLNHPLILRPMDILIEDKSGTPIGFTMKFAKDSIPLSKCFATSYRNRVGITPASTMQLVEKLIEVVNYIHTQNCLIVDANEFNFMVDTTNHTLPYCIDVDSYQTPSYQPTAIMPSIRDYTSNTFNKNTDWYSVAVLACQLFVGIHPYKGMHPNYPNADFEARCKNHLSIFNNAVSIPKSARDFSLIPNNFKDWFLAVFEKGLRLPPPSVAGTLSIQTAVVRKITGTDKFEMHILYTVKNNSDIIDYFTVFGNEVLITKDEIIINDNNRIPYSNPTDVIFTVSTNTPVLITKQGRRLGYTLTSKNVTMTLDMPNLLCLDYIVLDNRLYVLTTDKLIELSVIENNNKITFVPAMAWDVMSNTKVLDNVLYSDILGRPYFYIPFKERACQIIEIEELRNYRIIDAHYDSNVLMVTAFNNTTKQYDRAIITFDARFDKKQVSIQSNVGSNYDINFVVLDSGIVIAINENDEVEIFHKDNINSKKVISDPNLPSNISLCKKFNSSPCFFTGNTLSSIKMKK